MVIVFFHYDFPFGPVTSRAVTFSNVVTNILHFSGTVKAAKTIPKLKSKINRPENSDVSLYPKSFMFLVISCSKRLSKR